MLCNLWLKLTLIGLSLSIIHGSNVTVVSPINDTQVASESDQKHVTMISFHQPKPFVDPKPAPKIGTDLTPSSLLNASQLINHYELEVEDFDEPLHDLASKDVYSHSNHLRYSNKHKPIITDNDNIMLEPKSLQGYSKNVVPNFNPSISKSEIKKLIDFVENRTPTMDSTFPSSTHHSNHHFADKPHAQHHPGPHFAQQDNLQQHYSQHDNSPPQHFGQQDHLQHYSQQDFSQQPHVQPLHMPSHHPPQQQQQHYSSQPHSSQHHSQEINSLQIPPPAPPPSSSRSPHHSQQANSVMSDSESGENMDDDLFLNNDGAIHGFIEPSVYAGDSNEYSPELLDSRLIGYDSMIPGPAYTPAVYENPSLFSRIMSALFAPYTRTFTHFGLQPMSFSLSQRSNPMMPFNFNPLFYSPMILKRQCRFNCNYGLLKSMSQVFRFRYKPWMNYV